MKGICILHGEIEEAHPLSVHLKDSDIGTEANRHPGCIDASRSTTEHDHFSRQYAGHTAEQNPIAAIMLCQVIRPHHDGHPPGDLAHRLEERQFVAHLNRFVGHPRDSGFEQRIRELFARGKMEISEKNLTPAQQPPLHFERFFYFHDHLGLAENVLRFLDDFRAGLDVISVGITGADTCALLHKDGVPSTSQ